MKSLISILLTARSLLAGGESRLLYVRTKGNIAKTKLLSGEKGGLFASANGG